MANRLAQETSPYLLQHAHNPVDWYPWGEEALQEARAAQKPILVSIGYSACHWCHVMERESFEDPATAAQMNRDFVNIKIDREERPDLDQVFMDAVQAISGSGGWPLHVFLTPDGRPFFGGTYFPPVRAYNRGSWREVLASIASAWHEKRTEVEAQAENLVSHLRAFSMAGMNGKEEASYNEGHIVGICTQLMKSADTAWGGFGQAPKFPQSFSISFLLRQYQYNQASGTGPDHSIDARQLLTQALLSLDKMRFGGIYDQLQGGFARYATDDRWLIPHFEKMLYDNALLVEVYAEAWQLTRLPRYADTIRQTLAFVAQEWQDADGGFFSAFDADSEGEEGKYYTWPLHEVEAVIGDREQAQLFCDFFDVTANGNWEHTNILWVRQPLEEFCAARQLDIERVRLQLQQASEKLVRFRGRRIRPLLDDKKLMGWNALMISACCKASQALGEPEFLDMAEKAASFVEKYLVDGANGYHHNYKSGKAYNPAFLDDLAWYARALCLLQESTGNTAYLHRATIIAEQVFQHFADTETPFFFYTPVHQKDILIRKIDIYDGATPSGNSIMAQNLAYLGILLHKPAWLERAAAMVAQVQNAVVKYPGSFGVWATLAQWQVYGWHEIAVVGPEARTRAAALLERFLPGKVLQFAPAPAISYPLLAGKQPPPDKTWIYLCRQYACQKPAESIEDLEKMLQ